MSDTEIDYRRDMYITCPTIHGSATASVKNELFLCRPQKRPARKAAKTKRLQKTTGTKKDRTKKATKTLMEKNDAGNIL